MNDVFPKLTHPSAPLDDLRTLWVVIDISAPPGNSAVNLGEVHLDGAQIAHPLHGPVPLPSFVPGVQYHPGRKRWVVLYRGEDLGRAPQVDYPQRMLQRDQVDPDRGLVYLGRYSSSSRNRGMTLRFAPGQVDFVDVRDLLSPILLTMGAGEGPEELAVAAPVREAGWDLVDPSVLKENPRVGDRAIPLRLFGGIELSLTYDLKKNCLSLGEGILEAWPVVHRDFWKLTWVSGFFRSATEKATAHPLVEVRHDRHGGADEWTLSPAPGVDSGMAIGMENENSRCMVQRRVRVVGVRSGAAEGVFVIDRTPQTELSPKRLDAQPVTIAVDFGTSRSCVVVSDQETAKSLPDFRPRAAYASSGRDRGAMAFLTPVPTLLAYGQPLPTNDEAADTGPAAIILESALLRPRTVAVDRPKQPFIDYSIRPNGVDPTTLKDYEVNTDQSLKWDERRHIERVQYLGCLFLLAAAEAAARFGADEAQVVYSFPLAFTAQQKDALKRAMEEAVTQVGKWTGMRLALSEPVSESLAGLSSLGQAGGDWVLTMDVGGGTTDFALWAKTSGNQPAALAADSVEFGGDLLLEAAATVAGDREKARLFIRQGSFLAEELQRAKRNTPNSYRHYTSTVRQWRNWLAEYAARIVAGTIVLKSQAGEQTRDEVSVRTVLLGGGWNALDALTKSESNRSFCREEEAQHALNGLLTERVEALLAEANKKLQTSGLPRVRFGQLGVGILQEGREKLAIAQGIAQAQRHSKDLGISAPNGLDERTSSGTPVAWHKLAGSGWPAQPVFSLDADLLPEPAIPEADALLADLRQTDSTLSNKLRAEINKATRDADGGVYRTRTSLAIVFHKVLAPHITRKTSAG